MRAGNADMRNSDDDDILNLTSDIETAGLSASSSHSPRPAKRRRLRRGKPSGDEVPEPISDTQEDHEDDWSYASDPGTAADDDALPTHPQNEEDTDSPKTKALKRRVFRPKQPTEQEITFVTQLTQPRSSPSRIRGPRWKKPEPETKPQKPAPPLFPRPETDQGHDTEGISDDDEELRAAIAASLEGCEKEPVRAGVNTGNGSNSFQAASSHKASSFQSIPNGVSSFDIGDIPEDAFDTSPEISPNKPSRDPIVVPSQPRPSQPALRRQGSSQQQNLRQTTLFGGTAQPQAPQSQSFSRSWPLASQNEPPTHHKLDYDAVQIWVYPMNVGKKRDYQFNIAQRGLFHNLLVALPTGLGKTFIAATIMLNWFRWTTEAQIVFVAPTKPLVSQQVAACFGIAGIPRSTTTMLTGNTPPGLRAEEWKEKRVFFMTPQTLINDLKSGIADPKRIVLLVVDEAHRATGGYAYVEVVKFLQRFNSSFRVLALTATPGSSVEAVQDVIDGLNISRVEIRTEKSLDIREYVHSRNVEIQTFENTDEMAMCMELFAKALQPVVDKLKNLNAYWGRDPMALTPYGLTVARKQWMSSPAGQKANWGLKGMVNSIFSVLASLAHAIDLLKFHGIGPFFRNLVSFQSSLGDSTSGGKYAKQIANDDNFKTLMNRVRAWTNNQDFIGHPKLDYLRQVVLNHFLDAEGAVGETSRSDTRIMIFAHFRDSAEEIARVLKKHGPMIRPHVFVGQAAAKGSEGMDQKTQLEIIDKFKKGTFNTIVATSIGEEGLDIGEVDLIVCYDSSSSPIRMLQRMGRTGRKRQGNIILLLMKGKEEDSYTKAKDNYEKMQLLIASGSRFVFHDDKSPRILPKEVQPAVDEKVIEIPIENSQAELPEPTRRGRVPKRPPKRFNMPDDVETGFTKASGIGSKRRKTGENNPPKSPELQPVPVPSLDEVILSRTEQRELEQRYCSIGGTSPQYIRRPRNDAFPTLQRNFRPTKLVRHGRVTRRLVKAFRKMNAMTSDCEQRFRDHLHPDDESEQRANASRNAKGKGKEDRSFVSEEGLFCTQDSGRGPRLNSPDRLEDCHSFSSQASFDLPDVESLLNRHLSDKGTEQSETKASFGSPGPRPSQRRRQPFALDDSDDFDD